ncbi:MAG: DUF1844 domain-containing protein [Thermodesulfobacteriota bacterium]|nr:DUF1844 domain-containing protein [Thermodesulfobacteriota bacterium]
MTEEERGFVIKDKRSFDDKGDLKADNIDEERNEEEPRTQTPKEEAKTHPLPEVNFTSLIFSLSSTALFHLGEIADPQTNEKNKDLPLAKHTIDTIAMLKEKTDGNLTEEEQKFLESILTDLRWRYVNAAK